MVEKTAAGIIDFMVERARKAWDENRQPYWLSRLVLDLREQDIDYSEVLPILRPKALAESAGDKVSLVVHPTQKAKLGLIPVGETFSFDSPDQSTPSIAGKRTVNPRYALTNFLELLSRLDDTELEKVQIPISVLVRILKS